MRTERVSVACVYRTGGSYRPEHVDRLLEGVRQNLTNFRTICITDDVDAMVQRPVNRVIPLSENWPGWWAKIALFKLEPPVLYFDLDTVIVGDLEPLAFVACTSPRPIVMLEGFYRRDLCSGVMGWNRPLRHVYESFQRVSAGAHFLPERLGVRMQTASGARWRGDQEWLRAHLAQRETVEPERWQNVVPGIFSYKVHVRPNGGELPEGARVICFHGRPRPEDVRAHWLWSMEGAAQ